MNRVTQNINIQILTKVEGNITYISPRGTQSKELVKSQFLNIQMKTVFKHSNEEMSSHRITQPAELWTLTSEGEQKKLILVLRGASLGLPLWQRSPPMYLRVRVPFPATTGWDWMYPMLKARPELDTWHPPTGPPEDKAHFGLLTVYDAITLLD